MMKLHPLRPVSILAPRRTAPINHRPPAVSRLTDRPADVGSDMPGRREEDLARLEAVLWLAEEPIAPRKLAAVAGVGDAATAKRLIARLQEYLAAEGSAFQVEELAGGYQLFTQPEFYPWLVRLRANGGAGKLPPALLETLAIVAYRQPIMRADVEAIRGVHCGDALRHLMERKLVQIIGRHDSLGRPVLYGTTKTFLQTFGLKSLDELPGTP